jgi:hypothetical protein
MKTKATHTLGGELAVNRKGGFQRRQAAVKRRVKAGHLRHLRERFGERAHTGQVVGLVQRRQAVERGELCQHLRRDTHRGLIERATMHHPVGHSLQGHVRKLGRQQLLEGGKCGIKDFGASGDLHGGADFGLALHAPCDARLACRLQTFDDTSHLGFRHGVRMHRIERKLQAR